MLPSLGMPASSSSMDCFVFARMVDMLAHTNSAARASGVLIGDTSSGHNHADRVVSSHSPSFELSSRSRATIRAANMSPVPEKNTLISGTEIRNRRGVESEERIVEPTMLRVGVCADESFNGNRTDVTIICGIW